MDTPSKALVMIQNSLSQMRAAISSRLGIQYDGYRKVQRILGYKDYLRYEDYLAMYSRQDVAGRIVDMPAQESWRNPPKLVAASDSGTSSSFFDDWASLSKRIDVFRWFEKVDRLSGIGHFGVLFLGLPGNLKSEVQDDLDPDDLMYLMAYPEGRVEILELDMDPASPRFGLPVFYKIKLAEFQDPSGIRKLSEGEGLVEEVVHWTRCIHVAEDMLSDRVHGRPRLQRVFDRMWDLLKVTGGSSEMFWQNVAQIFHVNLDPDLEYSDSDLQNLDDKFREMLQGIRRVVQTEGIQDIKTLQGKTPDPRGVSSVLKTLIASAAEIPQRILFGSEQGEMASTQDKSEWYGRIDGRRERFCEPDILMQFVMRLASFGILQLPEGGVVTQWPTLFEETPTEKAGVARALAMAASKYDTNRPDRVIGIREIREAAGLPGEMPQSVKDDIELENERREEEAQKIADRQAEMSLEPMPDSNQPPNLEVANAG
jgi:hypothetical protein